MRNALSEVRVLDSETIDVALPELEREELQTLLVRNPDGQTASIQLWRREPPELLAVSPSRGPDSVPTWVLIEGRRLRAPAAVWFDGRPALEVEVSLNGERARAKTPLHPGGLVEVTWYNPTASPIHSSTHIAS